MAPSTSRASSASSSGHGVARNSGGYEGRAAVRFSARDDVEPLWQDVRAGIIRNVSVGYVVRAYEVSEPDGQVPVWRAVDWQPVELSAVQVGADGGTGFRQSQGLTPCRLIGGRDSSSINRAQDAQQPENTEMDQPMTEVGTDAADGVTSRQRRDGHDPRVRRADGDPRGCDGAPKPLRHGHPGAEQSWRTTGRIHIRRRRCPAC